MTISDTPFISDAPFIAAAPRSRRCHQSLALTPLTSDSDDHVMSRFDDGDVVASPFQLPAPIRPVAVSPGGGQGVRAAVAGEYMGAVPATIQSGVLFANLIALSGVWVIENHFCASTY